jgi:uncharacterized protein YceK
MYQDVDRLVNWPLAAVVLAACQGCGTVTTKRDGEGWGRPYSGTVCSVQRIDRTYGIPNSLLFPWAVLDIGLSFAADTLVLLIDLASHPYQGEAPDCSRK